MMDTRRMRESTEKWPSPVRLQHLFRMLARRLRQLGTAQHAGHFLSTFISGNQTDGGLGPFTGYALLNHVMMIREGRDLRQVSHAENLIRPRQSLQLLANSLRRPPADAGVDLVEDQGS